MTVHAPFCKRVQNMLKIPVDEVVAIEEEYYNICNLIT